MENLWLYLQFAINGIANGCLYALMALGMVLIFKTTDVVNFAQADMTMLSTFVAYTALTSWKWPFAGALVAAIIAAFIVGLIVERFALRPAQNAPVISLLITTLGVALIINAVAGGIWGYQTLPFEYPLKGRLFSIGNLSFTKHNALTVVVALVLSLGFFAFLKFTKIGIAMRATAQNKLAARLMGINVDRISMLCWGIGAAIGAVAGVIITPTITGINLNVMVSVMLKGFAAAVLGGFTSLPGALVGGLLIGVIENLFIAIPVDWVGQFRETFVFALIILILTVRPHGLLGETAHRGT
ncbi:branched-chain amino acid ABC transporter permease [Candidatus Acetothermia bacterium]|nr:branched-chain amino acid ABC transporter permease [Candidatus Acetothermia bacterium]MBI3460574.1 branched-chain amino acid ABC transporter permease [Candidatus Acetothermia bacterium]MBI3659818.1 branched-chain amino acid ABC transporter permease [Candidatus Acetothermia bacterium]